MDVDVGDLEDLDGGDFQEVVPEVPLEDREATFPEAVEG